MSGASLQLEPTIFNCFEHFWLCVIHCVCSDTHTQVFQENLGVLLTPQLVPPLQDCCAFQLVPMCTMEEDTSRIQASAMCITIFGIPGWVPAEAAQPKTQVELTSVVTRVCKCGCGKVSSGQMRSHTNGFTSGCRH